MSKIYNFLVHLQHFVPSGSMMLIFPFRVFLMGGVDGPVVPRRSASVAKYSGSSSQVLWVCNEVVDPNGSGTQIQSAAIFGTHAPEHATPMQRTYFLGTEGISDKS